MSFTDEEFSPVNHVETPRYLAPINQEEIGHSDLNAPGSYSIFKPGSNPFKRYKKYEENHDIADLLDRNQEFPYNTYVPTQYDMNLAASPVSQNDDFSVPHDYIPVNRKRDNVFIAPNVFYSLEDVNPSLKNENSNFTFFDPPTDYKTGQQKNKRTYKKKKNAYSKKGGKKQRKSRRY